MGDSLTVEERSVEASEIGEDPATVLKRELGVATRDRQVETGIELKTGLGVTTYGKGAAREVASLARPRTCQDLELGVLEPLAQDSHEKAVNGRYMVVRSRWKINPSAAES